MAYTEERLGMEKIYRRSERGRRSEAAELAAFLYDVYFAGHHHIDIYHRYKRQIFLMPTRKIHDIIIKIRYNIYRQRNVSESRRYDKKRRLKYRRRFLSRVCTDVCGSYVYVSF